VDPRLTSLGEFELQVLRMVWRLQPCTERQISDRVQEDRSVARTTVLKTIQRLEAKGFLTRRPGETPIRFRAAQDENHVLSALIGRFVDRVLGGSPGVLAAYLADSEKLSAKDIKALHAIAEKMLQSSEKK
jgi:BlaI family transcriptional regulator, penicillinase repressor